jgi:hypothetical protein
MAKRDECRLRPKEQMLLPRVPKDCEVVFHPYRRVLSTGLCHKNALVYDCLKQGCRERMSAQFEVFDHTVISW